VYPSHYQLAELTGHLVGVLERRRGAFTAWGPEAEDALLSEAKRAVAEARAAFFELADDPPYWARLERVLLEVAVPRYLRLAAAQDALERRGYDAWRGGDALSRLAFAGGGLLTAIVLWRTGLPRWLEPLPLSLFIAGPLVPDLQAWWSKRRYRQALAALLLDMAQEQEDGRAYQALSPISDAPAEVERPPAERDRVT
jgi:hypothetical protein